MIIKNITIENFQSYHGIETLEFSEGLNLIIGNGGKGKSKLFNAFYWVLFGKIYITDLGWCSTDGLPHSSKFAMDRHDFLNKKALYETTISSIARTAVIIEIIDDKGILYTIERSVIAKRLDFEDWKSSNAWDVSNNILKVRFDSNSGTKFLTDILATDKVDQLFPDEIRDYIWFQGESLDSLINFRNKDTLKAAVKHISYFPYYEKLSDIITKSKLRIEKLESSKISSNNKNNLQVRNLVSKVDLLRYKIENEITNKDTIENNISMIQVSLHQDEGKITGLANFTGLVNDYHKCEQAIKDINNNLTILDEFQRKQVPNLWILRGIDAPIDACTSIIKTHTNEQNTVPERKYLDNPGRTKLEEIIKDKLCFVCGTDVEENSKQFHWISNRLKEQEDYLTELEDFKNNLEFNKQFERFIGSIQDYPNSLKISIGAIEKQYLESEEKIEKLLAQKRQITEKKEKIDIQIEEIKKKFGVNPIKQAQDGNLIASSLKASRGNLEREQRKLQASIQAISDFKKELKGGEKELENISKKSGAVQVSETEWKNISIFLEDICKRVQENARKDLLQKIEQRSNEFYMKFTEHDKGYKGQVKIGSDYSIEFDAGLNTSHEDRKKMSIINAMLSLNQESLGIFYPFISDAPTSSFDIPTTHKYLMGIKDIFGQSIIMTKDVDVKSENYELLKQSKNIARVYQLESEIYCLPDETPELHEVSTKIRLLK
jgi:DNA sulfur modification protein DndD